MRLILKTLASAALLTSATVASAAVSDPTADFLLTYTGPTNGDVDIVSADVLFNGSSFALSESVNGVVGTTPNSLFIWAVNRGAGIARPPIAPPSIGASLLFDAVVVMFPDGTLRVVSFPAAGAPSVTTIVGGTSVSATSLSAIVPLSLLPSTGFLAQNYTFELWSRTRVNPLADGTTAEIADLAPGSGPIVAAVPEPGSWALMLLGFGFVGVAMRRRPRPDLRAGRGSTLPQACA